MTCFSDPAQAIAALINCIISAIPLCDSKDGLVPPRVHAGPDGTGEGLDCCPCGLLIVEDGDIEPVPGGTTVGGRLCKGYEQTYTVRYLTCFQPLTRGGTMKKVEDLTAEALALTQLRWDVLRAVSCCGSGSCFRVQRMAAVRPEGGCAGFELIVTAQLAACGCP